MTTSRTTPSQLTGHLRIEYLEKQIRKFWEMFDIRVDKDNAVNKPPEVYMLKLAILQQIDKFENEIDIIKTTPSQRIRLTHIECEPVWKEDKIELFDMYDKTTGEWLGSKSLLKYCEEFNDQLRSKL